MSYIYKGDYWILCQISYSYYRSADEQLCNNLLVLLSIDKY